MRTKRIMVFTPPGTWDATTLAAVLLLVERIVPADVIESWTQHERMLVYDWAVSVHLSASDNVLQVRPEPSILHPYSPDRSEGKVERAEGLLRLTYELLGQASERERDGREVGAARMSIESTLRCLKRRLPR